MLVLAAVSLMMLILPYMFGYAHTRYKTGVDVHKINYRYFVVFNIIIAGLFVTGRILMMSQQVPAAESSIYVAYAIAILSMMSLAVISLFSRTHLMLAPAIVWSLFLAMSSVTHLWQIMTHAKANANVLWVHIIYNAIVINILLRFLRLLAKTEPQQGDSHHATMQNG